MAFSAIKARLPAGSLELSSLPPSHGRDEAPTASTGLRLSGRSEAGRVSVEMPVLSGATTPAPKQFSADKETSNRVLLSAPALVVPDSPLELVLPAAAAGPWALDTTTTAADPSTDGACGL
jgi:hypothetical protein